MKSKVAQRTFSLALGAACATAGAVPFVGGAAAQEVLPVPPAPFKGQIGLSVKDSKSDFPQPVQAPKGAPNIVLILLDDVGYGASSTFGGPMRHADARSAGARTGCATRSSTRRRSRSPTRASLLTGRNHHSVHTGNIMELATGFPGYDSLMGKDTATVAEVLRQKGWNTAWFGKNHNVPDWQNSQAGPFDLWPTGLGFEKFYGFIGGRDQPVAAGGLRRDQAHRAVPGQSGLQLRLRHRRPGHRVGPQPEGRGARQAVLPLLRAGRDALPASAEKGVDREIQGQVRPGLGQAARGDPGAAEEAGHRAGRTRS